MYTEKCETIFCNCAIFGGLFCIFMCTNDGKRHTLHLSNVNEEINMPSYLDQRIIAYQQASAQAYQMASKCRETEDPWSYELFMKIAARESSNARTLLWQEA